MSHNKFVKKLVSEEEKGVGLEKKEGCKFVCIEKES